VQKKHIDYLEKLQARLS